MKLFTGHKHCRIESAGLKSCSEIAPRSFRHKVALVGLSGGVHFAHTLAIQVDPAFA